MTDGKAELLWPEKEIEALRQRVKELEGYKEAWIETAKCRDTAERELAALKAGQGEPVAYGLIMPNGELDCELVGTKGDCEFWTNRHGLRQLGWEIVALYTASPTCFSAGDMTRPPTPIGWSDTDWIKHLQEHQKAARIIRAIADTPISDDQRMKAAKLADKAKVAQQSAVTARFRKNAA